jgi:hypothetical protein
MTAKRITPILNVSNIQASIAWFEKLGWQAAFQCGEPPTFGGVCSGDCEIGSRSRVSPALRRFRRIGKHS